ncbi:MAG: phosphoribosylglycinamide formyltransferase [Chitinophagaceae bacterium]|jgi:formyltetrahydrofolate-dependent phosphoribosylglycinamide formyltransferase
MLNKLQQKWNVSSLQLLLILCTFAVTGTTTAVISRYITGWVGFNESTFWLWKLLLRIFMLVFGYQVILMIVAFFFGQFPFFWNYEKKILRRMGIMKPRQAKLAIFASGKGSNAEKIIQHFINHNNIHISLIVSNKQQAGVLDIAQRNKIPTMLLDKKKFMETDEYVQYIKNQGITHIILAGFLLKVPDNLINSYNNKIVNIHPALLPAYGGKGMYGEHVHQAVIQAGEKESGITIHLVDEEYDHGKTLFQAKVVVDPNETSTSLAEKIHKLEHEHYPSVIEKWVLRTS